ncbi:MAG TPA: serine hydrolase domain-containing protein [Dokdonella sp.]|uniref:serine hydrolase domain-containing protein n=1 Tax=Dokdonella sp. TaxID=2291710 RepID=UPI002C6DE571|nr:serine hydrolase domain-containing protein [Dokdonella sp.]HUD42237.1 serine hydrolase domain-containing protein [Dokdonella sp.]
MTSRRSFLTHVLALSCLPGSALAAPDRASPVAAVRWFERWLAAFNGPRLSQYAAFVRSHMPALVQFLDDDLGMREVSGGFVLLRQEQTGPDEITAWVRDRRWDRYSKVVLTAGDGRIDDLVFSGAPAPADFRVMRLDEEAALEALNRKLSTEADAGRFCGAVLVARGQEVLFQQAYGLTSVASAIRTSTGTRFCIGSMGKMFTAVAVLQLIQDGHLKLTDTLATLLPEYPNTRLARQVTVEHLLSHSGGTGDFFGEEYEKRKPELRRPSDYVRVFGRREALFPPGSRWGYSNFGFMLLGAIIEQVSERNWESLIKERVFDVSGMHATSSAAEASNTARPLVGARETGLRDLPFYDGSPAGGGYSTLGDLHRFGNALTDGRLLDAAGFTRLTEGTIQAGAAKWSRGLRVAQRNGAPWYGHGGGAPGVNADFAIYPKSNYRTVVLANRGHPSASNVADYIGARLPYA